MNIHELLYFSYGYIYIYTLFSKHACIKSSQLDAPGTCTAHILHARIFHMLSSVLTPPKPKDTKSIHF